MSQHVVVVPYNPQWPALYEQEAQAIGQILGENLTAIHHIGSTSVPGLASKPIIDIHGGWCGTLRRWTPAADSLRRWGTK